MTAGLNPIRIDFPSDGRRRGGGQRTGGEPTAPETVRKGAVWAAKENALGCTGIAAGLHPCGNCRLLLGFAPACSVGLLFCKEKSIAVASHRLLC